ncbi:hypothetical protein DWV00_25020 [Trinickia dinghuensis]|uniref:Uncharacterized protein n=2 Tax=Trinickia dinghuensis TaxID=2291023 RepID=A0A3D8JTD2_9BURK|nr:hypothetical protein [Trinickia dinghuensis]RDU96393.1 hypothetical protein DWV00_25020 [Trinickia dinghuensis]
MVGACADMPRDSRVQGVVWQVDNATARPTGDWHLLGVHQLLVQWTVVDDTSFVANAGLPTAANLPDWARIGREPWASDVVLGLAGYADEKRARAHVDKLVRESEQVARVPLPLHVTGYYFPVEVDPTWGDAPKLGAMLSAMPRPLWISVYDRSNVGGKTLADWLASWLPGDVGVFFQDGCGVYARGPLVARQYLDALSERLGHDRVRVIAEAFRPSEHGGFRPATAGELREQLAAYQGYFTYLFDGPHYVSDELVRTLAPRAAERHGMSP